MTFKNGFILFTKLSADSGLPIYNTNFVKDKDYVCNLVDVSDRENCERIVADLSLLYNKSEDYDKYFAGYVAYSLKYNLISCYYIKFCNNTALNRFKLLYSEDYELLKDHSRTFLSIYDHIK